LGPIFRDRDDFSAGHSLTEQTLAALTASRFLIVICSPNAARSFYVNEEIRQFKALGGTARIIPLIVDGAPGNAERECFAPALRFALDGHAALTDEREEPVAADAGPGRDGKEVAKQKIVAGLLGVGLDEIVRRAERARRRRNRVRVGVATAATIIVVLGVIGWTWAVGFGSRLDSAQMIGIETDTATMCIRASAQAAKDHVADGRRIAFAVKCVDVLTDGLPELARDSRLPLTFIEAFDANIAVLREFADQGKLTPEQLNSLSKAEVLLDRLKQS
jgi:hypothetical protein